jgi:hypothetical protein
MRSSIFAFNNLYTNYQNTIISYGSNIFSAATITGSVAADQMGATLGTLALGSLSYNGGITRTKVPQVGSIAIDMGNPSDVTNAQNAPIVGRRDVGAAELTTTYATDTQVACGPYTWIDGLTYTANNSTATHTLVNSIGFDSIVTLNLTIHPTYAIAQSQTICQGESYTLGSQTLTANGLYSEVFSSVQGCDSIINLTLTVNPNSSSTQQVQACGSYQWIDGNTYTSSNSTATFTLPNAAGCDSVVTSGSHHPERHCGHRCQNGMRQLPMDRWHHLHIEQQHCHIHAAECSGLRQRGDPRAHSAAVHREHTIGHHLLWRKLYHRDKHLYQFGYLHRCVHSRQRLR